MVLDKKSVWKGTAISGQRRCKESCVANRVIARVIGAVALVLLAGSSAFGQFIVQPMKVEAAAPPNKRFPTNIMIENLNESAIEQVDLSLVDITQSDDGVWQVIQPDDPNAQVLERSCINWLRLEEESIELNPLQNRNMNMWIEIPVGKRGNYFAGILASTRPRNEVIEGYSTNLVFQFLIPVIIEVQGRPMRNEISLVDTGLLYEAQTEQKPAATYVTMKVQNAGGTFARLKGISRVWAKQGGHWRKITETEFPDRGILPGVTYTMKQDVGRPLGGGGYKVQAFLYVDEQRGDQLAKELEFEGDRRIIVTRQDAVLSLDPGEVTISAMPGAMRQERMTVINSSEESVNVDAEAIIPRQMIGKAMQMPNGLSVRGEDLSCMDWVRIEPRQFSLRGYGRQNIRIVAQMPEAAAAFPDHYAMLRLHASYPDGQLAGTREGIIFVETRGAQAEGRVEPVSVRVHESGPSRYIITASFTNKGMTHVLPRCHGRLLMDADGMIRKRFPMSELNEQVGRLLPFESRSFTGILDVSDVAPGLYRLAAVLQHDKGLPAFNQQGIEVKDENGTRVVEVVGLEAIGGETVIEL